MPHRGAGVQHWVDFSSRNVNFATEGLLITVKNNRYILKCFIFLPLKENFKFCSGYFCVYRLTKRHQAVSHCYEKLKPITDSAEILCWYLVSSKNFWRGSVAMCT
uniref:Uncharacterized protein n=1 Tax=Trypanosoma congolense (strain IL3000) TaxID=1068625 RepID=G0UU09_TRYCI|nr:hypothetical protein, unlikely [Trypanosoma congolense IL3000]